MALFLAFSISAAGADNQTVNTETSRPEQENISVPGTASGRSSGPANFPSRDESRKVTAEKDSREENSKESLAKQNDGAAAEVAARYLSIPILYMTDRQIGYKQQFINDRKHEVNSIYEVYCGNLNYTLSNLEKKNLTDERKALGWTARSKSSDMTHELLAEKESDSEVQDKFAEAVVEFARKTGQKEIFLFAHGFNSSFESSARCAALLSYHTERPVILYSWPSKAKMLQYFVDSGNNEWSQEHFNRLIEMLYDLKKKHGISINIVAHSMGNRLVIRAAPILETKVLFSQLFMVDPDLDSETFLHYLARYARQQDTDQEARMHILFSHRDNALRLAQLLVGGYTRLGQGVDTIAESIFKPTQIMPAALAGTKSVLAHKKSAGYDNVRNNLFRKGLDWIDFTALDHGIIGHSIPYKLIASLSQTASPGSGLAFEPVEVGVSDFKNILFHHPQSNSVSRPLGLCRKVVFSSAGESTCTPPLAKSSEGQQSTP